MLLHCPYIKRCKSQGVISPGKSASHLTFLSLVRVLTKRTTANAMLYIDLDLRAVRV